MKLFITLLISLCSVVAADIKSLPNQAGNGDIDLAGTVLIDPKEIQQVLDIPMPPGYIVVRIKVSPRTSQAIRISPDDFSIVSRKDGERSAALEPSQIGGPADMALQSQSASSSPGVRSTSVSVTPAKTTQKAPDSRLQKILESKILPDTETKEPVEGLLYFLLDGKNKPKDLGLLYKGPAGRLSMDFK